MGVRVRLPSEVLKNFKTMSDKTLEEKRLAQQKETWIVNIVRIQNLSRDAAEKLYDTIKPHNQGK